MNIHVLNGDALAEKFPFKDHVVICREAFIDGPLQAKSFDELWKARADHHGEGDVNLIKRYSIDVSREFEKLLNIPGNANINLWFEHDLFCQVNMWFVIFYLDSNKINNTLFRVMPIRSDGDTWAGFGMMPETDLQNSYNNKIKFEQADITLALNLWKAYQQNDLESLISLSNQSSPCFQYLKEVCQAHADRFSDHGFGRPQKKLKEIKDKGLTNFKDVFKEFSKTEAIYGFGDLQVKNMLAEL